MLDVDRTPLGGVAVDVDVAGAVLGPVGHAEPDVVAAHGLVGPLAERPQPVELLAERGWVLGAHLGVVARVVARLPAGHTAQDVAVVVAVDGPVSVAADDGALMLNSISNPVGTSSASARASSPGVGTGMADLQASGQAWAPSRCWGRIAGPWIELGVEVHPRHDGRAVGGDAGPRDLTYMYGWFSRLSRRRRQSKSYSGGDRDEVTDRDGGRARRKGEGWNDRAAPRWGS